MPVKAFKAERFTGGRSILHGDAPKLHFCRVQCIGKLPDMIFRIRQRRCIGIALPSEFGNACRPACIFDQAMNRNAHFFPSFSFFWRSSRTALAAARPLVICGPMPSPDIPCAPANSRPSIKWSSSFIPSLATA